MANRFISKTVSVSALSKVLQGSTISIHGISVQYVYMYEYDCPSHISRTAHPTDFTVCACIAENQRERGLECAVDWLSGSREHYKQPYRRPRQVNTASSHNAILQNTASSNAKQAVCSKPACILNGNALNRSCSTAIQDIFAPRIQWCTHSFKQENL